MADGNKVIEDRPATIIDVAKAAGVSFKTVSRVLNGETNVREATREKVRKAVSDLRYIPNHNARNLRAQKSRLISILFSNPSRNYVGVIQWGALKQCQAHGYNLTTEDCSDGKRDFLALKPETDISGVVLTPPLSDDLELQQALASREIPFVRIAADQPTDICKDVCMDDFEAAREMTEYLIKLGHNRIAFINGPEAHAQASKRLGGYLAALREYNVEASDALIMPGEFSFDSGLKAAQKLLEQPNRPTAIFASNDDMAAGAITAAYRQRVVIPDELSVVGFDDTPLASTIAPALTTIYQPSAEMASEAVTQLLETLSASGTAAGRRILNHKLVIRESSGPPPSI